jgi:hypothetical protein
MESSFHNPTFEQDGKRYIRSRLFPQNIMLLKEYMEMSYPRQRKFNYGNKHPTWGEIHRKNSTRRLVHYEHCFLCKKKTKLVQHHIENFDGTNHIKENVVLLCEKCHRKAHTEDNRFHWSAMNLDLQRYFQNV